MAFGEPVLELERGLRYRDHERQVEQQLEPRRLPMAFAMAASDDRAPPRFRLQHLAVPRRRAAAHASRRRRLSLSPARVPPATGGTRRAAPRAGLNSTRQSGGSKTMNTSVLKVA